MGQGGRVHPVIALTRLGGIASPEELRRLAGRGRIRRAVKDGSIVRVSRNRLALPTANEGRLAAARLSGVLCLRSAAAHHGWAMKEQPPLPEVAVDPRRRVVASRRRDVRVCWMNVAADDHVDGVTTPLKTVVDCARHLHFDEALAIADSALRSGMVTLEELGRVRVRGAGAAAVRRVLQHADGRAANPFESVLRALCIEAGLEVEPQAAVDLGSGVIHPDLVCRCLRAVMEADSWTFHASRRAHRRDCARYNLLVVHGWRVLRFTWEQVMLEQAYVRWVLAQLQGCVGQEEVAPELAFPA